MKNVADCCRMCRISRAGSPTDGSGVRVEKDLNHVPAWDSGEGSPFMNLWMVDLCASWAQGMGLRWLKGIEEP